MGWAPMETIARQRPQYQFSGTLKRKIGVNITSPDGEGSGIGTKKGFSWLLLGGSLVGGMALLKLVNRKH